MNKCKTEKRNFFSRLAPILDRIAFSQEFALRRIDELDLIESVLYISDESGRQRRSFSCVILIVQTKFYKIPILLSLPIIAFSKLLGNNS